MMTTSAGISSVLCSVCTGTSVTGKCDSCHHSTTSFSEKCPTCNSSNTGHQMFNRSFIILGLREGLTSFNKKKNSSSLSGEKKSAMKLSGLSFSKDVRKNSKLNLVALIFESQDLYCFVN